MQNFISSFKSHVQITDGDTMKVIQKTSNNIFLEHSLDVIIVIRYKEVIIKNWETKTSWLDKFFNSNKIVEEEDLN